DQRDVHGLPFTRFLRGVDGRRQEAVNAADLVAVRLVAVIVLDLHFVAAAQVDAAIASFRIAKFGMELGIGNVRSLTRSLKGVALTRRPSRTVQPCLALGERAFQPERSLPLNSSIAWPHFGSRSRFSDGARRAVQRERRPTSSVVS